MKAGEERNNHPSQKATSEILNFYGKVDFFEMISDDVKHFRTGEGDSFIYPAHFHSVVEIYYVVKGKISVTINGRRSSISNDQIFFANGFDIHSFDTDTTGHIILFQFGSSYLRDFKDTYGDKIIDNFLTDKKFNRQIYLLLEDICNKHSEGELTPLLKCAYVNMLLNMIIGRYGVLDAKQKDSGIFQIIEYIYNNFHLTDLGLSSLAKEFNYSQVTVSRMFNRRVGMNIRQFINSVRVANAQNMLRSNQNKKLTVTEIASRCGFDSMTTFYRHINRNDIDK